MTKRNFINKYTITIFSWFYQIKQGVCYSDLEPPILIVGMDEQESEANLDYIFYVFFCNIIIVNYFLYSFIILMHLISPFNVLFLYSFHIYGSVKLFDCILLSLLALNAVLLTSSLNIFCFFLLNLCFYFNINLLFSYTFFVILPFSRWFMSFSSRFASRKFIYSPNLCFCFMTFFFVTFAFFIFIIIIY